MGHGVCQVAASSGKHNSVIAYETEQRFLDKGQAQIEGSIAKMLSKGKISSSEEADRILNSIKYTTDSNDLANVDFLVRVRVRVRFIGCCCIVCCVIYKTLMYSFDFLCF